MRLAEYLPKWQIQIHYINNDKLREIDFIFMIKHKMSTKQHGILCPVPYRLMKSIPDENLEELYEEWKREHDVDLLNMYDMVKTIPNLSLKFEKFCEFVYSLSN